MPAVQSHETSPGHFVTRDTLEISINWIIGAVVGGSVAIAGGLSIVLYIMSVRRQRAFAASETSSAESPHIATRNITLVKTTLTPLGSIETLRKVPSETRTLVNEKRSSGGGLRAFFGPKQKPYVGSLTRKTTLRRQNSMRRFTNMPASALGRKSQWLDEDALHGPPTMHHSDFANGSSGRSKMDAWLVGPPTLPDLGIQQGVAMDQNALEQERERFYRLGNGDVPYPMFSGKRPFGSRNTASAPTLRGYGLETGNLGPNYSTATSFASVKTTITRVGPHTPLRAVTSESNSHLAPPSSADSGSSSSITSSDAELRQILRSTDQRLQVPKISTSAIASMMRTPTSSKTRNLKSSPSRTPVFGTSPLPGSPEQAKLACTLNVARWHILTPEDMNRERQTGVEEVDSDTEDSEAEFEDDVEDDEDESILTQEFSQEYSTVLSPSSSCIRQSVETDNVEEETPAASFTTAPESTPADLSGRSSSSSPSARSDMSSALSTLYSVDEREDAPSPPHSTGAMSDASTKFDADVDDSSSADDPFLLSILGSFPISKHHSIKPLSPNPLKVPGRKVFSCPPPPRITAEPAKSPAPTAQTTVAGSLIRLRQPGIKLTIPPFSTLPASSFSSDHAALIDVQKKRSHPNTPGTIQRKPVLPPPSGNGTKRSSITIPKKSALSGRGRAVYMNNDNVRMITPIKGSQIRTVTSSAALRNRAMAARQRQAHVQGASKALSEAKQKALRPMRSSPTLGSHDHGAASVSSPGTSGSSSPESNSAGMVVFKGRKPLRKSNLQSYSVPTVVVSTIRPSNSMASMTSGLSGSYSNNSILSVAEHHMTPSPSFQMAMSRGAGPSGVFIPQSTSTSSFDLTPLTALDVTITELRRRNSGTPGSRAYSYSGPPAMNMMGMGVGLGFNNNLLMDSPTLPRQYTSTPMTHNAHKNTKSTSRPPVSMQNGASSTSASYNNRRRTHTGLTSSGSVAHLGNNISSRANRMPTSNGYNHQKRRQMQVMSKASREDMRAGIHPGPTGPGSAPAPSFSSQTSLGPSVSRKSSFQTLVSTEEMELPPLTQSLSGCTDENLLATPGSKPARKPSVTFAKTDDVLLLSDDSNSQQRLSLYDENGFLVGSSPESASEKSAAVEKPGRILV